jgi:pilus assembly protein FimV
VGTFTGKQGWLAVACALAPSVACAAGLGKITVHSALGQPLRAEIEVVSLQPGEAENLIAKLAPAAAFRQADIEYNGALQSVKFAVERRPGGGYVVAMSSAQPLNEPYVDMLVEMNWASGKLLREYTFLLDPPEYHAPTLAAAPQARPAVQATPAPVPVSPAPQAQASEAAAPPQAPAEAAQAAPAQAAPAEPAAQAAQTEAPVTEASGETTAQAAADAVKPPEERELVSEPPKTEVTYEVKHGDTLGKIALRNKVQGVTLQQMLVALFRANQEAFVGDNMNRLRAGKIITLPGKEQMAAVGAQDARRFVGAQMADFADYRRSLGLAVAEAPAHSDAGRQTSGKIASAPEQQSAPAKEPAKDQLRLSSGADAKRGGNAAATAAGDDAAAKDKALKDANERVAMLEKNVADMQKLLALKSGTGAQAQQQAEAAKAAPAAKAAAPTPPAPAAKAAAEIIAKAPAAPPAAKAAEPAPAAKSAPTQVAQAAPAAAPKAVEAPKAAETARTEPAKAEPAKATDAVKVPETPKAAVATAAKAAPKAPPPPPAPDVLGELLASDYTIPGGAGLAVVLLGYAAYAWRKKKREASAATELSGAPSSDANSVFGTSGGQNIDTASSSFQSDFSQSGMGKIDSEEIDPIAEADVYMAYGRDAQAEEILKEALTKDSSRPAIRLKLLEIYANRKDTKAFQEAAGALKSVTGGSGPEWDKALSLGRSIDPQNSMYAGGAAPDVTVPDLSPPPAPVMPDLLLPTTEAPAAALDFNLDLGGPAAGSSAPDIALDAEPASAASASGGLDFDLGLGGGDKSSSEKSDFSPSGTLIIDAPFAPASESAAADAPLNFDLELPGTGTSAPASTLAAPAAPPAPAVADGMIEFDLGGLPGAGAEAQPEPAKAPALDLSAISLDMGAEPAEAASGGTPDPRWQEVATKLDLAKAYDEMGDKDGARELLKEVVKEGDTAQQQRAQSMLQALGAA